MNSFCVDPGNDLSAFVIWDGSKIVRKDKITNNLIRYALREYEYDRIVCEMIASYGMPVGKTVFDTCVEIGRFVQMAAQLNKPLRLVYRNEIKIHICKSPRANDGTIRQALIDRIGPIGKKANPGPTFGITGDMWSALAVAVYDHDTR